MAGNKPVSRAGLFWKAGCFVSAALLLWAFPPFRLVKASQSAASTETTATTMPFNAAKAAEHIWSETLPAGMNTASDLLLLTRTVQANPTLARKDFAHKSGLGASYYFARGSARVVSREGKRLRLVIDETNPLLIELRLGPVFGNTVRDGTGLLDVNNYPGLQEYNTLSSELNALVERQVLPLLLEKAVVGTRIHFTGCAEAPEAPAAAGAPVLVFIPIKAEVR